MKKVMVVSAALLLGACADLSPENKVMAARATGVVGGGIVGGYIGSMFGGGFVAQADMTARQNVPNNAEPAREPVLLPLTGFIDSRCMPIGGSATSGRSSIDRCQAAPATGKRSTPDA